MDLAQVWADIEDRLVPYLRLEAIERAFCYHLLRQSLLKGRKRLETSKRVLARGSGLSNTAAFNRMRSLERKGCLKVLERSYAGIRLGIVLSRETQELRTWG